MSYAESILRTIASTRGATMFQWLIGDYQKRAQARQSDRSERNAVIRRIVTAAAKTTPKPVPPPAAEGDAAEAFDTSAAAVTPTESGGIPRDKVAERAYEIWVENGRPTGTVERDWQQAVRELAAARDATPAAND